jgi:hypothetical protein
VAKESKPGANNRNQWVKSSKSAVKESKPGANNPNYGGPKNPNERPKNRNREQITEGSGWQALLASKKKAGRQKKNRTTGLKIGDQVILRQNSS